MPIRPLSFINTNLFNKLNIGCQTDFSVKEKGLSLGKNDPIASEHLSAKKSFFSRKPKLWRIESLTLSIVVLAYAFIIGKNLELIQNSLVATSLKSYLVRFIKLMIPASFLHIYVRSLSDETPSSRYNWIKEIPFHIVFKLTEASSTILSEYLIEDYLANPYLREPSTGDASLKGTLNYLCMFFCLMLPFSYLDVKMIQRACPERVVSGKSIITLVLLHLIYKISEASTTILAENFVQDHIADPALRA